MPRVDFLPLVPAGLMVDAVEVSAEAITVTARSAFLGSECPRCGRASGRLHSRYGRSLIDLPSHGRAVRIKLSVRRFRCIEQHCGQRIFAERLGSGIAAAWARRTSRLEGLVHHVGLALGGRPAASLACRLVIPVSRDTLLRTVRRHAAQRHDPLRVVGIDDWAWKRGHRYGTILCDLERRQIVDLLPDREGATVEAWLSSRPTITTISRDRGGGYGRAASRGRPGALQIADRWHLMENASASFLQAMRRSMRPLRQAISGPGALDPSLLTSAERLQFEGYRRRRDMHETIYALVAEGIAIKEIVRRTGDSRRTVRQVARGGEAEDRVPRRGVAEF